jgi:hypothetical protein
VNQLLTRLRSFLTQKNPASTAGRNDPCPCGSGKKYKRCCIDKLEQEKLANLSAAASQSPFGGRSSPANRAMARMKRVRRK